MRYLSILGSTGSIGRQALAVAALHPDRFRVIALTAHRNAEALFAQVAQYRPALACLTGVRPQEARIPAALRFCQWEFGERAMEIAARDVPCDDVLVAVVGMLGLPAVMAARAGGRRVLLANKEALVAGGQLVMRACPDVDGQPTLLPVDSEHSAIFQCLRAAGDNAPEKLLLTTSGGVFRDFSPEQLERATLAQALVHPKWRMGEKITVDSATLFNKALEIIEARWLFDMPPERIEVLVHPQSVVHSMVQFGDGAVLAQLSAPDMRVPLAYAMAYPERIETGAPRVNFAQLGRCDFFRPDTRRFPAVDMAYEALRAGGAAACVLNAANEVANLRFRQGGMRFTDIARVVRGALDDVGALQADTLDKVYFADGQARRCARAALLKMGY